MSNLRSTSRSKTTQDLTSLSHRRPSWTPSLSEYEGTRLVKSHSRRRARHDSDFGSQEWSASFPQSRGGYHSLPSLHEAVPRAKRPRVVDEVSPSEQLKISINGPTLPESPEDGKRFRSWEINVKDLVGDAVGNMSMSPNSRDIALAARRGLFILDLESLDTIPRFLPQGGTWDVADVQWNPHLSHAQYIVSTSSEKLLIWNLRVGGKTSIQHILKAHYRAITDINWHTSECDVVCSIGIDSWIWAWDIRTPRKPVFGLSPFKGGGTQVKWNYKDANLLASAHADEVLIWDRRKGSLPVTHIQGHASKIYGIDWSRSRSDEIVTCSLDKTIKIWDTNSSGTEPKGYIRTNYPVWRARNLPFGEGILILPQRGETTLEMYAKNETQSPVEIFEGHTDVVKEFVWRRGPQDDFQLVTWSKDRTLRFWPIDAAVMEKVGYKPELIRGRAKLPRYETENMDTFSHPPEAEQKDYSAFSAPFLNRTILAEVRAPLPPRPILHTPQPHKEFGQPTPPASDGETTDVTPTFTASSSVNLTALVDPTSRSIGGKMSKAGTGFKSVAKVDQLTWLASVKEVSSKRGSSSGGGSFDGGDSVSRLSSTSRPSPGPERSQSTLESRQRSGSLSRLAEERAKEADNNNNQSLQDEITTVLTRLAASKIKLEKYDLSKKRTCTLGLHSPLGEKRSVYVRVTLTFPRDYPQATYPNGSPTIELERNPLISLRRRDFILKHLRRILERKRPCFEACLRFLLFADDGQINEDLADSDTSSDEDQPAGKKKTKEISISLRDGKNWSEPRSSQGVFGPNGDFICFFQSAQRVVHHTIRGLTEEKPNDVPAQIQEEETSSQTQKTSYFQSPALVADAVRRLSLAAVDRNVQPGGPRQQEMGMNIVRAMTNLLTLPHKVQQESDSKHSFGGSRRSPVFIVSTRDLTGADKIAAEDYIFTGDSLAEVCEKNADAAKAHRRFDHERVFRTLRTVFRAPPKSGDKMRPEGFTSDAMAKDVVLKLYSQFASDKDIQMLAMISMLVLQTEHGIVVPKIANVTKESDSATPRPNNVDYFSLKKPAAPDSPVSFPWVRMPSPKVLRAPSVSSSTSSRGSWSSLFNAGTMRQFMTGVQDTFKEGLLTPSEIFLPASTPEIQITTAVTSPDRNVRTTDSNSSQKRKKRTRNNPTNPPTSKSWSVASLGKPSRKATLPTTGDKRLSQRFVPPGPLIHEKRVVFEAPPVNESAGPLFDAKQLKQFRMNIYFFAELLFRWQMYHKRLELLKAVAKHDILGFKEAEPYRIGLHRLCTRKGCQNLLPPKASACQYCSAPCLMPVCTVCRLPAKGLTRTCAFCSHVTHVSCWDGLEVTVPICPAGCGCFCGSTDGQFTRPSTSLGFTPPTSMLMLATDI